ncbi:MAG: ASKHA domain-containing protein [Desulfobacteraceae bacterium]|jgi:uncharacterized 2Fe-2S/4Fe-4S cluster protein (DUF4445 family)
MAKIIFMPQGKEADADGHMSILQLAQKVGLPLQSTCGGKKKCGKCKVVIEQTDASLPPPSDQEREHLGELLRKGYRLACDAVLAAGAQIQIPEESLIRRQVILTSHTAYTYPARLRPNVEQYYVEVPAPTIDDVKADRERFLWALQETFGLRHLHMDAAVIRELPRLLRSGKEGLTALIRDGREIIGLQEELEQGLFGIAFDTGTTTVVGYLMDLLSGEGLSVVSAMNPQIPYGDDVISRISFCQQEPGGLEKLRSHMVQCLNDLITESASEAGINPSQIVEMTVVGNTAMHHLFLGLDPQYLSMAPYTPVLTDAQDKKALTLGIEIGPSAYVHLLPLKAGFVGSDAIACILATGIHRKKATTLLIDLGTNGEIVLGSKERLVCCSTAAGPAFEGGHIRWGMRAAAGAIERVRIDPARFAVTLETIDGERPLGICGSGIIAAVAEMIRAGIVLGKGNFNENIQSSRLRHGEDGWEFVLAWAPEAGIEQDIVVTQKDVAELQMAKSAIYAGATLLMEIFGGEPIQKVLLAGAGGNYVDPRDACTIDLFPGCTTAKVIAVGNAAGHGSCLALLDKYKRKEAERIAKKAQYIELAATERFQELFVSSMFFTAARDYENDF